MEQEIIIKRGDIYYADLSPVIGSEQGGIRPIVVLQNDIGNKYSPTIIVAAITSQINKAKIPTHIELNAEKYGLSKDSVILLEQIRTIDKKRLKQKISTLSKGYLQRTGIAAAVMHNPQLLILDEPTEGLDPNQKTILRRYLQKYAQNALVLISTHLLEEAEVLNSRMLILVDGKICQDTTVDQLRTLSRDGTLADAFYRLTMENINQEADNNVVSSL